MLAVAYFTNCETFPKTPVVGISWTEPMPGTLYDKPTALSSPSDSIRSMAFYLGADAEKICPPRAPFYYWN